jgi:glycosyltransferase involved in cell wall biosynthesis
MRINPQISVIMAVYNGEKYLAEAIESILNQTFKEFEFIIIDDGSKDNSLNIIKRYAKKDSRIIIIKNEKNMKLAWSLNKGLKIARGKYIARMDSDDISLTDRLEKQYYFLEKKEIYFYWEHLG